ncbi:hypothetical protein CBW65_06770 [Tumebacillus avium]|uniref:Carrier domain-containing protein n=1 Tax=Tumebacillus avium TaxID=1903704 RepID=A0A1Y0ILC3_9BACL|nr:condensation domain-containing protein [Tumebacillus avium]ARU60829.1 hypothetical protein CBW65_06770 [Tumebacillus avium]
MSNAGKLDKQNVEDIWPLTPVQEGMLFHYLSDPDSQEYFQQIRLAVTGELDKQAFEQAWQEVVAQNELLRTVFRFENVEKPLQIVLKQHAVPIRYYDFTEAAAAERQEKLDEAAANDAAEHLDLTSSPFRITLCRLSATQCELIISSHHILYDGWSNGILLREFSDKYNYLLKNEGKVPVRLQKTKYKEWIKWQLQQDKGVQQNYWQSCLRGFETKTELPADRRHHALAHKTVDRFFSLSEELTAAIKRFVRVQNLTLSTLFHTAWGILLQKYNNTDDVVFGTTVSGRSANLKGIEEIVGLFINTIPLRLGQKPGQSVADLLRQTGQQLRDHQEYEHTPLVDIKGWSAADRKESLFDSIVVIQNYPLDMGLNQEQNALQVKFKSTLEQTNYDMVLVVNDFEQPEVYLSYNSALFAEETISRLAGHLISLIEAIIKQPEQSVAKLSMLTAEERRQLVADFNQTAVDFSCDLLVHQRIEEQAERTPDRIAIVDGERTWTYRTLNERANQLAKYLRETGIGREGLVPILGERSAELVAGMLAVFKAGGAYVPLDVHYPVERLLGIFQEIGSTVLLTASSYELSHELIEAICAGTKIHTLLYLDEHGDLAQANERLQRAAQSVEQDVERLEVFLRGRTELPDGPVGIAFTTRRQQLVAEAALDRLGLAAVQIDQLAARREKQRLLQEAAIGTVLTESRHFDEWDALLWESDTLQLLIQLDQAEADEAEGKEANLKHLWNFVAETSTTAVNDYGWTSSYTGQPFSPEEMGEYIGNFKRKLLPCLKPDARVLEIGCGHGLVMFEIAPQVGQYVATDLSGVIIEKNRARLQEAGLAHVELYELAAREIGQVPERGFDAVISSSVVHFFPNTLYLEEVIRQSIELLGDEGIIYLDDMMDVAKKAELVASMRDYKEQHPAAKVKTDWDEDLFVPEQLFRDLQVRFPEIISIESTRKTGVIENELTSFRYDVLLRINKRNPLPAVAGVRKKRRYTGADLMPAGDSSMSKALLLAVDSRTLAGYPTGNLACLNEPQDLCYVIYTSGSTGKPKGVMIEHIGMTNHMLAKIADFAIGEDSAVGQVASHCFDQSIWQFFAPLITGGRTVLYSNEVQLDLDAFIARLLADEVTVLQVVPVYLALLADALENELRPLPHLQVLGTSGEALKPQLVSKWFSLFPKTRLINSYGATECSDDFTHYIMEQDPATNPVSIGTPVQNVVVYVLDKDLNLCPVGVKGEICASGISVGRGYLNNAEKTNAAFLRDPFADGEVRLYRTGDRGRWLPDGSLEFSERIDHQVKIRSYRVELGEIEAQLLRVPGIVEAVVLAKDDAAQNKFLCAYFVADGELSVPAVKEQLARELPEYMIPAHFLRLEQIPLTDNGKIDKKALPEPDSQGEATIAYAAPTTELETELAGIWQDVLDVQDVGIHDHFFDLGGIR